MFKFLFLMSSLLLLVGCNNEVEPAFEYTGPTRDYFAILDTVADDGWQSFVLVSINDDGIVTDITLDGVTPLANSTRREVSKMAAYYEHFGYRFYEQVDDLAQQLIGNHRSELVTAVRTTDLVDFDTTIFADLVSTALNARPVVQGIYLDGSYRAFSDVDADGYHFFVNLFVLNGEIVAVHFNAVDAGGNLRYEQIDSSRDQYLVTTRAQLEYFAQLIIALQDPMVISFDIDGFAIDFPQLHIPVEPLIVLVTRALAAGPVVD